MAAPFDMTRLEVTGSPVGIIEGVMQEIGAEKVLRCPAYYFSEIVKSAVAVPFAGTLTFFVQIRGSLNTGRWRW